MKFTARAFFNNPSLMQEYIAHRRNRVCCLLTFNDDKSSMKLISFRYSVVYGGTLRAKRVQEFCLLQALQTNTSGAYNSSSSYVAIYVLY